MSSSDQSTSLQLSPEQARTFVRCLLPAGGLGPTPTRDELHAAANALGWGAFLVADPVLATELDELAAVLVLIGFYSRPAVVASAAA